uniref:Uncharacterized protein n=1 Tax=Hyaloperonospora arabidopsidis (strain Emoy2) TaxID=559515 RepID=M4BFE4_HYAAE
MDVNSISLIVHPDFRVFNRAFTKPARDERVVFYEFNIIELKTSVKEFKTFKIMKWSWSVCNLTAVVTNF